ncbi:hypothetical protein [Rhodococcus sp. IEGM 1379]|uniref:hypothetical protein n=1 Tax=Rhodococcus sp. IEGM 1379 TaxID=3047086 RepID=UPI0024B76BA2|nr:hypothetical protein [Rhodococcus sp. IEGM 1379]MDI9919235.1 hypothetical protein [Rhodococcus sp. IEGM 1379]
MRGGGWHARVVTVIRLLWIVVAIIATALGVFVASWSILEITDCEIGLSLPQAVCDQSIWGYFGWSVLPVLAVPVLLCLIPAVVPRAWAGWVVAGVLLVMSVVGFFSAFTSSSPSLLSVLGSFPAALLAVLLAIVLQVFSIGRTRLARQGAGPVSVEASGSH